MRDKKQELLESELRLLKDRVRHPYLHNLLGYLNEEDLVLDLGCGLLVNLNYLKDSGFNVVGVDISSEILCMRGSKDLHLICADGLRLPFKENNFAGILLIDIIEHLPTKKVDEFIGEVKRIVQDDGVIFLHVPLEKSLSYRILNKLGIIWPKNPNHAHDYTLEEVRNFVKKEKGEILWEHKENGIAYSLQHHLKGIRPLIIFSRLLERYFQDLLAVSYTACLNVGSYPGKISRKTI